MDHLTPEVADFLSTGTRTHKLGYTASDGRPLVAPVWFVVKDGALLFNTGKETAKGRPIRRDPRLVLCVDLEEPPYAYVQVQVQGTATISEDPTSWCAAPRRSRGAIWGRTTRRDSDDVTGCPASCSCDCSRRR